jgi:hypothetical protein
MFRIVYITFFIFLNNFCFSQDLKANFTGQLFFGSGFGINTEDSISLKIGNAHIYNKYRLHSIKSYGKANGGVTIFKIKNKFYGLDSDNNLFYLKKTNSNTLSFSGYYKNNFFIFHVNFDNGKYIIFNSKEGKISIEQLKNEPVFM